MGLKVLFVSMGLFEHKACWLGFVSAYCYVLKVTSLRSEGLWSTVWD